MKLNKGIEGTGFQGLNLKWKDKTRCALTGCRCQASHVRIPYDTVRGYISTVIRSTRARADVVSNFCPPYVSMRIWQHQMLCFKINNNLLFLIDRSLWTFYYYYTITVYATRNFTSYLFLTSWRLCISHFAYTLFDGKYAYFIENYTLSTF